MNETSRATTTSGRSEKEEEGRSPSDLADLTELRNFSPTLEKSMVPPPWPWDDNKRKALSARSRLDRRRH